MPYPLSRNVTVNEALAYFDAAEGNVIKSQNLFAIYDPIIGWAGTLNYMEKGIGYMIKSESNQNDFKYPAFLNNANSGAKMAGTTHQNTFPKYPMYGQNMNAVVRMPAQFDYLYIFNAKGELRGQSNAQMLNGQKLSFITIYGEQPEDLTFHIGNAFDTQATTKVIGFVPNAVLGTIANPLVLDGRPLHEINVYPNPYENEFSIQVYAAQKQEVSVWVFSVMGQQVLHNKYELQKGYNTFTVPLETTSGVHIMELNLDGIRSFHRIIRK